MTRNQSLAEDQQKLSTSSHSKVDISMCEVFGVIASWGQMQDLDVRRSWHAGHVAIEHALHGYLVVLWCYFALVEAMAGASRHRHPDYVFG